MTVCTAFASKPAHRVQQHEGEAGLSAPGHTQPLTSIALYTATIASMKTAPAAKRRISVSGRYSVLIRLPFRVLRQPSSKTRTHLFQQQDGSR